MAKEYEHFKGVKRGMQSGSDCYILISYKRMEIGKKGGLVLSLYAWSEGRLINFHLGVQMDGQFWDGVKASGAGSFLGALTFPRSAEKFV